MRVPPGELTAFTVAKLSTMVCEEGECILGRRAALVSLLLSFSCLSAPSPGWADWPPNGQPVCVVSGQQFDPIVLSDGSGAIVAWIDYRAEVADIYASKLSPSGDLEQGWSVGGVRLGGGGEFVEWLRICSDESGGAYVTWDSYGWDSYEGIRLQRVTSSGQVPAGWPVDGLPLSGPTGSDARVESDGSGGALVMWVTSGVCAECSNFVRVQRINADATPADGWPPNGLAAYEFGNTSVTSSCDLISDESGGAYVVWEGPAFYEIHVARVTLGGALDPSWPPGGVLVSTASGPKYGPSLAPDGSGGLLAAWHDRTTNVNGEIYVQRFDTSGLSAGWPTTGVEVPSIPSNDLGTPSIVADGAGGAFLSWDYNADVPGGYDVVVQRITATGQVFSGWPSFGLVPTATPESQRFPSLVPDGSGGVYVAWHDTRTEATTATDIYAQRVAGDGQVADGWPVNGHPVCNEVRAQFLGTWEMTMGSDGSGGAYVTWEDSRSIGNQNIYLSRLGPAIVPVVDATVDQPHPRSMTISPSPFSSLLGIRYQLPGPDRVSIRIHDLGGRIVRCLVNGVQTAGVHTLTWDGRDDRGVAVPSGIYLVAKTDAQGVETRRVPRLQ